MSQETSSYSMIDGVSRIFHQQRLHEKRRRISLPLIIPYSDGCSSLPADTLLDPDADLFAADPGRRRGEGQLLQGIGVSFKPVAIGEQE